jgi:hypothetical protein
MRLAGFHLGGIEVGAKLRPHMSDINELKISHELNQLNLDTLAIILET